MKKLYTLLVIALIGFVGNAQIVNIPDANFKAKLLSASSTNQIASIQTPNASGNVTTYAKIDTNNDSEIQVSEALAIKWLSVSSSSIANLTGIESFTNLQYLKCDYNQLTSLNVIALTNLQRLYCNNMALQSLNVSGLTNLQYLSCRNNLLTSLDVSGLINLKFLDCSDNNILILNVNQNINLEELYCFYNDNLPSINVTNNLFLKNLSCGNPLMNSLDVTQNLLLETLSFNGSQIASIDLSQNIALKFLSCGGNGLSSLDISNNIALTRVDCYDNQLTDIDISNNNQLVYFYCNDNLLTEIDVSQNTLLRFFRCQNNQLSSLNLSQNVNLWQLICNNNLLTSLDLSNCINFFNELNCSNNQISTILIKNGRNETILDFSNNPNLNYICSDEGELVTIQNKITQYGYTNCHANSYCSFSPGGTYYTIQGTIHFDVNANGCDINDIIFPNQKFTITNGTISGFYVSDTSGNCSILVNAGTHTVTPIFENPSYFSVSPATVSVIFPTTASPFTQNFCVTANGVKNDLEVTIIPIEVARPGFDAFYKIIYKNKGNQLANGSLSFTFNDAIMDLVTASPIVTTTGTNSLSWNYANLNPFETREINLTFNINSPMETPAVNGGDILNYNATIIGATDETPTDNVFSLNQTVVNSFDPNDKTCLEGTTITPSMVGNYVHYVIRFENTGTFAAQNVVIKDMIDTTKFDVASLIPQSSSHPFVTRIINTNQVEFIFENINLPFDDATNDGYVAFKIKTKPTLVLGNTFTNTASIYFDYNFPIITNTAATTVAALGNQDFDFGSVFTLSPVPAKDVLTISTKQDVVVSSVNIYNTLGQLVQVHTNPNETIDVSSLQSGSYFVRITSDKGSATGKFLKE